MSVGEPGMGPVVRKEERREGGKMGKPGTRRCSFFYGDRGCGLPLHLQPNAQRPWSEPGLPGRIFHYTQIEVPGPGPVALCEMDLTGVQKESHSSQTILAMLWKGGEDAGELVCCAPAD